MDELNPRARALLDAAARADQVTSTERARSAEKLRAALSAHGIDLPPITSMPPSAAPLAAPRAAAALWVKLSVGGVVLVSAWLGLRAAQSPPVRPLQTQTQAMAAPRTPEVTRQPETALAGTPAPAASTAPHAIATLPITQHPHPSAHPRGKPADDALARELRVLTTVDELVRRQRYQDALHLLKTSRVATTAAPSPLEEERQALHVIASCGRARDAEALRARARFLRSAPHSLLAARVRTACEPPSGQQP